jgi:hypothetical protein
VVSGGNFSVIRATAASPFGPALAADGDQYAILQATEDSIDGVYLDLPQIYEAGGRYEFTIFLARGVGVTQSSISLEFRDRNNVDLRSRSMVRLLTHVFNTRSFLLLNMAAYHL